MPVQQIREPISVYTDTDGTPLEDGYIYVGESGLNPQTNPISVYWDINLTIPAGNIRTKGGYPTNNGSPGRLFISEDYSVLVKNKLGEIIYSVLENTDSVFSTITRVDTIFNQGILTWDTDEDYLKDVSFVADQGIIWKDLEGTTVTPNQGNRPYTNQDKWAPIAAPTVLITAVDADVIATQYNHMDIVVDVTSAVAEITINAPTFEGQKAKVIADGGYTVTVIGGNGIPAGGVTLHLDGSSRGLTSVNSTWVVDNIGDLNVGGTIYSTLGRKVVGTVSTSAPKLESLIYADIDTLLADADGIGDLFCTGVIYNNAGGSKIICSSIAKTSTTYRIAGGDSITGEYMYYDIPAVSTGVSFSCTLSF